MENLTEMHDYNSGYFKAILDIYNVINYVTNFPTCKYFLKSKKKYSTYVNSMLKLLLENPSVLDSFREHGGFDDDGIVRVNAQTGEMFCYEG